MRLQIVEESSAASVCKHLTRAGLDTLTRFPCRKGSHCFLDRAAAQDDWVEGMNSVQCLDICEVAKSGEQVSSIKGTTWRGEFYSRNGAKRICSGPIHECRCRNNGAYRVCTGPRHCLKLAWANCTKAWGGFCAR